MQAFYFLKRLLPAHPQRQKIGSEGGSQGRIISEGTGEAFSLRGRLQLDLQILPCRILLTGSRNFELVPGFPNLYDFPDQLLESGVKFFREIVKAILLEERQE